MIRTRSASLGGVLVAVCITSVLLGSGVAGAAPVSTPAGTFFPVGGPRLAGEEVLWTQTRPDGGFVLRRGSPGSSSARTIFTRANNQVQRRSDVKFAASAQEVLVSHRLIDSSGVRLLADPIDRGTVRLLEDGEAERLGPACRGDSCAGQAVDLFGSVGIFPGSESETATIRDLAQPASTAFTVTDVDLFPRLAGRYAAWISNLDVVVYDRLARAELYRLDNVAEPELSSLSFESLDVQEDGKVAFVFTSSTGVQVGWASPSEPFVHRLPLPDDDFYTVKLVGDLIAFLRTGGGIPSARGALGTVDLDGRSRILVRPVEADLSGETFDFDGPRLAWIERTCAGARIQVSALAELAARPRLKGPRSCRLRLSRRPRTINRGATLVLRFGCAGFERRCSSRNVSVRTARSYRVGGVRVKRGASIAGSRRGSSGGTPLRLDVSRVGRRLLRERKELKVVVRARVGDPLTRERRSVGFSVGLGR